MSDDPLLWTVPESAVRLRLGESTVWRLISNGELAAVKIDGSTRVRESELQRFVEDLAPAR